MQVGPMSRADLERMPQLQGLLADLKEAEVDDLVWRVLGGHPEAYMGLWSTWRTAQLKAEAEVAEQAARAQVHANASAAATTAAAGPGAAPAPPSASKTAGAAAASSAASSDSEAQAQAAAQAEERVRRTASLVEAFLHEELHRAGETIRLRARQYAAANAVRSGAVKLRRNAEPEKQHGGSQTRTTAAQLAAIVAEEDARVRPALALFHWQSPLNAANADAGDTVAAVTAKELGRTSIAHSAAKVDEEPPM